MEKGEEVGVPQKSSSGTHPEGINGRRKVKGHFRCNSAHIREGKHVEKRGRGGEEERAKERKK